MPKPKRILVAPLDWGLGHATRSIPIIRELLRHGAEVLIASNGRSLQVLKDEFPELPALPLPPYDVRYQHPNMIWNVCRQAPRLLRTVAREHRLLQRLIRLHHLDAVISDNRFGFYSRDIPCVFITHQVHIRIPNHQIQALVNRVNHWFIRQYSECWIPDVEAAPGLAGALAHPAPHTHCRYIGWLSRLVSPAATPRYELMFLLSGPEPQRTRLEGQLLAQARHLPASMLLVQGKPEVRERRRITRGLEIVSYLNAEDLSRALAESRLIICRSGYSTLMDLARLGKQAILIPTPGQTEQEYLAGQLMANGYCLAQHQAGFNLSAAWQRAASFSGLSRLSAPDDNLLTRTILDFLSRLDGKRQREGLLPPQPIEHSKS